MTAVALDAMHELVGHQADIRPHAPALTLPDRTLTYGELDAEAEALAGTLRELGVGPGNVVPVLLVPSAELVVAVLAVLKTGAAYAALEPAWPVERLRRIAALLAGQVAVTGSDPVPGFESRVTVDGRVECSAPPPVIVDPDGSAAMVFFTSGSTGEPKAVLSPHRATARLFFGPTFARFDTDTVMAQTAAVPWDAFALELWGPLLTGGTCVMHTDRPLTPAGLRDLVRRGVNTVFLTTSLFNLLVDEDIDGFAGLMTVMTGGEKLSAPHAARFRARWPHVQLLNAYGPVESTIFALTHEIDAVDGEVPLGLPVPRTTVVVLRDGRPVPDGEVGELCMAGDGLALGYLGDEELTAAKFVTVELDGEPTRVYRTGDLGFVGADGLFHFRGRMDRQIKRRGHRIEPAGVESVASGLSGVARCAAVPRFDDNGNCVELVLFYVPSGDSGDVAGELARLMPAQAAPDRVVAVPSLPLSANGKLDVRALLATLPAAQAGTLATATEEAVAKLLGIDGVDRDTPLTTLGMSSLGAIRLCARLSTRFDRTIPVSRLLGGTTIAELAAWLDTSPVAVVEPESATAPLTPMQHGFVFRHLAQTNDLDNHCLLSWMITGDLDQDRLAAAVATVHTRHGYLSGRYDDEATVTPSGLPAMFERHYGDETLLDTRLRAPFDLAAGHVWRAVLVRTPSAWLFGVAVHHAAFDGWSQHVLADELSAAYAGTLGDAPPSPARTHALLAAATAAADLAEQRQFWQSELAGIPELTWPAPTPDGPTWLDFPAPAATLGTLLPAVHQAIAEHTGQTDFGVGVPITRRGSAETQRPVGCLIDTVCVRLRPDASSPERALAHADLPFADVVRLLRPKRTGRHPLYQVIVAVQDFPAPSLALPGCTTEHHPHGDAAWSQTELVVELYPAENRLRVTRDPATVSAATMTAIAEMIRAALVTRD